MSWAETSEERSYILETVIPGISHTPPNFLPAACKSSYIEFNFFLWLMYWQRLRRLLSPIYEYASASGPDKGRLNLV